MLENPLNYTECSFIESHFSQRKLSQKIYENFVLLHLKKFHSKQKVCGDLKNILHINTAVGRGGAAKIAYNALNNNLNKHELNSKILVGTAYCEKNEEIELIDCKNVKLHKLLHRYQKTSGLLDFYNLASFDIVHNKAFNDADVIHLHNLHGAYFSPFLLPKLTSLKPTIWTLHDEQAYTGHCAYAFECDKWLTGCGNCPDLNFYPKIKTDTTNFLLNIKKKIYDMSDFTISCPSEWLKNRATKSILKDKEIRVIYNGINEKIFINTDKIMARKSLNLPLDKKILLFSASGSIKNPQKGGQYILEAYKILKDEKDILFVNVGSEKKSKKTNWIDIPYISDERKLALYYSAADIFIYPSLAETFGLVIGEAMSCGTPVVAFNSTAVPEIVRHLKTGYLAEHKNINDFVAGIKELLKNHEFRTTAGIKSRELIESTFTLDKMINNYANLYHEVWEKQKNKI